ncbi:hypothetical protein BDW22DRAFT_637582 [Trametopsis cervina]|nr:hypothetical protein BDW22DRAFT_637582 [Trametopsis cervina]
MAAPHGPHYHSFNDYDQGVYAQFPGIIVPQQVHIAQTHYVVRQSIAFYTRGSPGVRLQDALTGHLQTLDFPNSKPQVSESTRTTLRIIWPGYEPWTHGSITVRHHNTGSPAFTMGELAHAVAAHIHRFYEEMANIQGSEPQWALRNIAFERLYLVELRHVSAGSWQPVICWRQGAGSL